METKHHDFDNFADYQQKYRENVSRRDCQWYITKSDESECDKQKTNVAGN
jgi:hypothetical protein